MQINKENYVQKGNHTFGTTGRFSCTTSVTHVFENRELAKLRFCDILN
jgi:hypothetical protein